MPIATRTFRVFVSSTFEDLKEERDALQREVFPKLRKLCEQHGARFQAIDLRWGVRDEAALDQKTMEICLREIERCQQTGIKPNFIVLLGDRYGWRPLPARLEAAEFERILTITPEEDRRLLLCEENQPAGGKGWYRRDDNAVPAEYILRPRALSIAADAPEEEKQAAHEQEARTWRAAEKGLREIFSSAITRLAWSADDPRRAKYEASATHHEILKGLGQTEEDRRHLYAFFHKIFRSVIGHLGLTEEGREHVFAFFRKPAEGTTEDPDLAALKRSLREKLAAGNVCLFSASEIDKLCAEVKAKLSKVILAESGKFTSRPALDLELEAHEAFALDRVRHFTGRQSVLTAIGRHIRSCESRPLVVHGASGCGKSAIVAMAAKLAKDSAAPSTVLIQRYIGVTPDSSSGISMLSSLCQQLSREYGVREDTPKGFHLLIAAFHDRMARATAERPLVLFLDALDQLRPDDQARSFTWLHQNLPPHVSLIVSTTEIPLGLQNAAKMPVENFPAEEAEQVLTAWLAGAKRELQPGQREKVLSGFARWKLPLYLKLAFEEARRWRSFDPLDQCALGDGLPGIIDRLFVRLSDPANHGHVLVSHALGYLTAARHGLTEDEMLAVLTNDDALWTDVIGKGERRHHDPPTRQLPVIVWSRLYLDLEPYLTERSAPGGAVLTFFHRQVGEQAASRFLEGSASRQCHSSLAAFFERGDLWVQGAAERLPNRRKLSELAHQQIRAGLHKEVEKTLSDCRFWEAKCGAGMSYDLVEDCERALAADSSPVLAAVMKALAECQATLSDRPALAVQTLYNRLRWVRTVDMRDQLDAAEAMLDSRRFWIRLDAPMPGDRGLNVISYPCLRDSACQAVSEANQTLVAADVSGELAVHRLTSGQVLEKRRLPARGISGIALSESGDAVAYIDRDGWIGSEVTPDRLAGRPGEKHLLFDGQRLVAVQSDDALVEWRCHGPAHVLRRGLCAPIVVLKPSVSSGSGLCVAGWEKQSVGILRSSGVEFEYAEVPYAGAPILDADFDEAAGWLAAVTAAHEVRVINIRTGEDVVPPLSYEQLGLPLRGASQHCALSRDQLGTVTFATIDGQVACWRWRDGGVILLDETITHRVSFGIVLLRMLRSGQILVSTEQDVTLLDKHAAVRPELVHRRSVTSIAVSASGMTASLSQGDDSFLWHVGDPIEPAARRAVERAVAVTGIPGTESVLIVDHCGRVWRDSPDRLSGAPELVAEACAERVMAICSLGGRFVACGTPTGAIVRLDVQTGATETLRRGNGYTRQLDLVRMGGANGVCCSLHTETSASGGVTVSLVGAGRKEEIVLRDHRLALALDAYGDVVCACTQRDVLILRRGSRAFGVVFSKPAQAARVGFLGCSDLIAVALMNEPTLEVWRVREGLPAVATTELPSVPTCMSTTAARIVVGFENGDVLFLRLMDAEDRRHGVLPTSSR